mmetsp:Transcript_8085/g.11752  ORF Transcript_8085/g.11752 Transcript_8085/m.11752 type:complete len:448 (+) Transcript_8085:59-1402(+)|eukprot:CAMPEP_0194222698 /NCGR_PEP_ID=MMETSP0156-20130528/33577_1 /TAXON_ID=33649 /ORGANISM="Thalassionema nitzschioides, Strain L26-B" /LENGTH=447 /DNA_ID=CAMNT_0038953607 /DNA_START=11 /DNA_END=1354 /DNA_ORIENTATION=-
MLNPTILIYFYFLATHREKDGGNRGRQRYDPKRRLLNRNKEGKQLKTENTLKDNTQLSHAPPPTNYEGPFPTYFTCRHTYEETLMQEIARKLPTVSTSSPLPGLVRAENIDVSSALREPIYALQELPECRIATVSESIKGLAREIVEAEKFEEKLRQAPKGSLKIHALVPGMCKGQKEPLLKRRCSLVADAVLEILKKKFPAARNAGSGESEEIWLLQILLLTPDTAAASLSQCQRSLNFPSRFWPNPSYPLGLANVDIESKMPSSAYRKLLEALACWGIQPSPQDTVVDLGASPGGWTAALVLLCQCRVIAVDRSSLDPRLMNNLLVTFVKGDAFTYEPPNGVADWMVSDIIAYPERVSELLDLWCGRGMAKNMVVTVKFQGETPSWEALDSAIRVAQNHGYDACAKHFFNNKNEVTLMIQDKNEPGVLDTVRDIEPTYKVAWPKS